MSNHRLPSGNARYFWARGFVCSMPARDGLVFQHFCGPNLPLSVRGWVAYRSHQYTFPAPSKVRLVVTQFPVTRCMVPQMSAIRQPRLRYAYQRSRTILQPPAHLSHVSGGSILSQLCGELVKETLSESGGHSVMLPIAETPFPSPQHVCSDIPHYSRQQLDCTIWLITYPSKTTILVIVTLKS